MSELHDVSLVDFPVAQYVQMQEHNDAVLRELSLIATSSDESAAPRELIALAHEVFARYGDAAGPFRDDVAEAVERGEDVTTLRLSIPYSTLRWTEDFLLLFEEADEYCASGDLLAAEAPPEVVMFRRWVVGELIRQIRDGATPTPYWAQSV